MHVSGYKSEQAEDLCTGEPLLSGQPLGNECPLNKGWAEISIRHSTKHCFNSIQILLGLVTTVTWNAAFNLKYFNYRIQSFTGTKGY